MPLEQLYGMPACGEGSLGKTRTDELSTQVEGVINLVYMKESAERLLRFRAGIQGSRFDKKRSDRQELIMAALSPGRWIGIGIILGVEQSTTKFGTPTPIFKVSPLTADASFALHHEAAGS